MLLTQLLIGAFFIAATVVLHAVVLDRLMRFLMMRSPAIRRRFPGSWKVIALTVAALGVFGAHIVEIWIWALFYLTMESAEFQTLEKALYFSTTSFTTVGYGDIVLGPQWRMLGSIEAANGFLLFGWSTAFLFEVMSKLYRGGLTGRNSSAL